MSGQTRKIRNVVYNNLEDNYGAVISANHEALAQILEQVKEILIIEVILIDSVLILTHFMLNSIPMAPETYTSTRMILWNHSKLSVKRWV
jgi:hypothetical protein